jgi:phosphatidylglycerophosphate synthase
VKAVPTRDEYFAAWSEGHGGYDPRHSKWAAGWLTMVHTTAAPLVRIGFSPNALTLVGGLVALSVLLPAWHGGRLLLLCPVLIVLSALLDSLDGGVAVMTGRSTRWGALLDSVVDRVGDSAYLVALWLVGAPAGVCVAAGGITLIQEYIRTRAAVLGVVDIGVITVWERPTRVVVAAMFLLGAGWYLTHASQWASAGAYASLALATAGVAQLLAVVHRRLHT